MKIKVFASNSVHGACSALFPMFEQASGTGVEATFGAAKALLRQINEGERADLALLGSATIDELVQQGRIGKASVRPLASSGVGVGVKAGTPHPKIDTLDAFIAMLLNAESIAQTTEGASGMYFSTLLDTLGIADRVRPKTRTRPGGLIGEVLLAGGAQIGIQQISELRAVPGVDVVGGLPAEVQKMFPNAAGIFADAAEPAAAAQLITFLTAPSVAAVYEKHGLTPG